MSNISSSMQYLHCWEWHQGEDRDSMEMWKRYGFDWYVWSWDWLYLGSIPLFISCIIRSFLVQWTYHNPLWLQLIWAEEFHQAYRSRPWIAQHGMVLGIALFHRALISAYEHESHLKKLIVERPSSKYDLHISILLYRYICRSWLLVRVPLSDDRLDVNARREKKVTNAAVARSNSKKPWASGIMIHDHSIWKSRPHQAWDEGGKGKIREWEIKGIAKEHKSKRKKKDKREGY